MQEKGVAYSTICNSKRSLKAIFYMAVQDDCLRKNPFDFQINEVINDDTVPKVPLTPTQENELLDFMQNDPVYVKYYDEVVILLETGLRISELCGLTPADLNFECRPPAFEKHRGRLLYRSAKNRKRIPSSADERSRL